MAVPTLTPASQMSKVILPVTGNPEDVSGSLAFGVYSDTEEFLSGAAAQVEYTFRKLGGEILDIELSASNVYAAYEEACLEYSYILNIHQSKIFYLMLWGHLLVLLTIVVILHRAQKM